MDPVEKKNYLLGTHIQSWEDGVAKTITFIVTEDCQLRCKYCYLHGKNNLNRMSLDVAKAGIDYFLKERDIFYEKSVILDFIGGEPFLEIDLIDKLSDYFKLKLYELNHPWFENYRFSFSTNGIMYDDERVQKYIAKNKSHLSIGITIDGTKNKHDAQRVFPDGSGSYDMVVKQIPLWLEQFPGASTKVTIAHNDLPFIKESVIHLWGLGIRDVNINVVYENIWSEGDSRIFENELCGLADYIIENDIYQDKNFSFFTNTVGNPCKDEQNWCGAGKMLAIDYTGNFYPCVRFAPFSMAKHKEGRNIGNIRVGLDLNKIRPFLALTRSSQSTRECIDCEIGMGCAWCQGLNFDESDTSTIYQRAVFICGMHKARVRANNYYWEKLYKEKGITK